MSLIGLLVFVIVIGLLYWCITLLPSAFAPFKQIAIVVLILIAIIYLVNALGLLGTGPRISIH